MVDHSLASRCCGFVYLGVGTRRLLLACEAAAGWCCQLYWISLWSLNFSFLISGRAATPSAGLWMHQSRHLCDVHRVASGMAGSVSVSSRSVGKQTEALRLTAQG